MQMMTVKPHDKRQQISVCIVGSSYGQVDSKSAYRAAFDWQHIATVSFQAIKSADGIAVGRFPQQ